MKLPIAKATALSTLALMLAACGDASKPPVAAKKAAPDAPLLNAMSGPATPPAPPAADGRYEATLAEGIQFAKPGLPIFVRAIEGMSHQESWGRWSDGPLVKVTFAAPLPKRMNLEVTGSAFGPNLNVPVKFSIGGVTQTMQFPRPIGQAPVTTTMAFDLGSDADTLEIAIPKPEKPGGPDTRELGIALMNLRVHAR